MEMAAFEKAVAGKHRVDRVQSPSSNFKLSCLKMHE